MWEILVSSTQVQDRVAKVAQVPVVALALQDSNLKVVLAQIL